MKLELDNIRKELCKYSIAEVSGATGLDLSTISKFRSGKSGMCSENLIKIINFLYHDNNTEKSL